MKRLVLLAVFGVGGCILVDDSATDTPFCGDGAINLVSEQCDDGNSVNGDGCSSTCARESRCGDGVLSVASEECDDGNNVNGDGCSATCVEEFRCGDGAVNQAGEQCDDGNQINGDGCSASCTQENAGDAFITANWQLRNIATNTPTGCPTGYDTAAVFSQPVNASGAPIGPVIIDLFTCSTMTGTTAALQPALYKVWIEITDQSHSSVYAQSLSAIVDITTTDKLFSAQILNDGGYFQLSWMLRGADTNNPLTCAQAGASGGLESVGTDVSTPTNSASDIWDCADGFGVTAGFLAATYTVSVAALGASSQSIGTAPALTNRAINNRNRVTDLGMVTVPIAGM